MYVCLCNGITDKDIKAAVQDGATSVSRVYRSRGCKAQCGKCSCQIRDLLRGSMAAPAVSMAAAPSLQTA